MRRKAAQVTAIALAPHVIIQVGDHSEHAVIAEARRLPVGRVPLIVHVAYVAMAAVVIRRDHAESGCEELAAPQRLLDRPTNVLEVRKYASERRWACYAGRTRSGILAVVVLIVVVLTPMISTFVAAAIVTGALTGWHCTLLVRTRSATSAEI